jgi:hypothetical protein
VSFPIRVRYRIASHGITGQAPSQAYAQEEAQEDASPYPSSTQQIERFALSIRVINATNSTLRAIYTRHQRNKF